MAWPPKRGNLLINGRVNNFFSSMILKVSDRLSEATCWLMGESTIFLPEQSSMILKAAWPPKRGQAGFLDRISFRFFIYQLIGGSCIVYHNTITSRCRNQVYFHSRWLKVVVFKVSYRISCKKVEGGGGGCISKSVTECRDFAPNLLENCLSFLSVHQLNRK